jgi:hypothetical protein
MAAPSSSWPQINVRLEPGLYEVLYGHLSNPLLTTLPKKALHAFLTVAIRNELTRRGVCLPTESTASTSSPGNPPPMPVTLDFF